MFNDILLPPSRGRMTLALLLFCAGGLTAAPSPGEPLSLSEALALALVHNPTLKVYAFESRVAEARILQAGIKPNPELSIGVEDFLGTGAISGVKGLETTLQLSQVIDLGGSRARRVETAESERTLADADYETKRIDVLAEVARRFTETAADGERLAAATRARKLGEHTVATVSRQVEAAMVSPMELNKARTALALLRITEGQAEHELAACRYALAAILGESEPTFGTVQADLVTLPAVDEFGTLVARLDRSPVLARFAIESRWREAQGRLAQSLQRSGTTVSGGLRRTEATDDWGFVVGVSIPLPVRNQQLGAIRESRERRAQLASAAEAQRSEMRAVLFDVYQEMLHTRTALDLLQGEVIPMAEETMQLAEQGYQSGRFSLLELLDAQKSVIALRSQVVANATTFHLHVIEIERLLGAPIHASIAGE